MAIEIENIGNSDCEVSGGFSSSEVRVAFLEDLEVIKEPKKICGENAAANLADLVTINDTHVFKAGKGFITVNAITETVGLETAQIGDSKMSPVNENKLTLQMLGSKPEILGFKRLCKGRDLIVIAPEFGSGQYRQIGSAKYAGRLLESSSKIETSTEGENTTTLVFQDKQMYDAPIYKGDITKQPVS